MLKRQDEGQDLKKHHLDLGQRFAESGMTYFNFRVLFQTIKHRLFLGFYSL